MHVLQKMCKGWEREMNQFVPKLFDCMKSYSKEQCIKDIISGIIVAIIALPLSIALALASGVGPEQGIYTAIFAGFVISFLGGSRVQIAGPTAAFATIVAGIVAKNGMQGLVIATIMAGIILIIMGFLKFGNLIKFIPYTITTGFTAGIAVTIAIGQIKDFLGLTFTKSPIDTIGKAQECINSMTTFNWQALVVGVVALAILIIWPRFNKLIPPSLIAVIVSIIMVKLIGMDVKTIGDLYTISNKIPGITIPEFNMGLITKLLPDAFTIAILAGIESLLSCVVSDGMIGSRHKPNMELVAQGYPKTSLASIEDFEQAFRAHAAAGRDVLCLVFTSKMSGCVGSARNARDLVLEDFPDARIEVIDSAAATVTESTMVENAVAMRDAGCTLDETVTWLEAEKATNQIFFTVGNLDYLIKGGRIGKVTGRAANMLGIKPMILFKDGEIFSGGVARGRQKSFEKALEQLMNYLDAHGGTPDDYRITVGYGYDEEEGKRLWMQTRAALRAKYPGAQCEVGLLQIGCTIAVHTGPYALGMGVMRRWKKQG